MATVKNTITLQDKMTPILSKMMRAMNSTMKVMESMNKASGNIGNDRVFKKMQSDILSADNALKKFNNDITAMPPGQQKVHSGFSGWQAAIITANQALKLFERTVGRLVNVDMNAAMDRMDTMSNYERKMTAILGSNDAAKGSLSALNKHATGTAYGLDTVAKATQNLVTRNRAIGNAVEDTRKWMDAVAFYGDGTNDQFKTVMDAVGKMSSKGKVSMDQLNRITDVGINAVGIYEKATGKAFNTNTVHAQEFLDVVTHAMDTGANGVLKTAGAAQQAGSTWATAIANTKSAVNRGVISIMESIDRMLEYAGLQDMKTMVINFGQTSERVFKQVGQAIERMGVFLAPVIRMFRDMTTWISDNSSIIIGALTGIAIVLATVLIPKIYETMLAWALTAVKAIGAAYRTAMAWLKANWQFALIAITIGILIGFWNKLGEVGKAVGIGIVIALVLVKIALMMVKYEVFAIAWPLLIVIGIVLIVAAGFIFFGDTATQVLGYVVGGIYWLGAVFANIGIGIANGALATAEFFVNVWNDATYYVQLAWYKVKTGVLSIISSICQGAQSMVNTVLEGISNLINKAISGINMLISAVNQIPGVNVSAVGEVSWSTKGNWSSGVDAAIASSVEPTRADRADFGRYDYKSINDAFNKGQDVGIGLGNKVQDGIGKIKDKLDKAKDFQQDDWADKTGDDWYQNSENLGGGSAGGSGNGNKLKGGKLDEIGKIGTDVSISDEDLKYMRDVAKVDYVNQYTTLRPEVIINIDEVKETADINQIFGIIEDETERALQSVLVGNN